MPSLVPPVLTSLPAEQPVLTEGELHLRPWRGSDAPALVAAYADPAVQHWHGERLDEAEAEAYADEWAALCGTESMEKRSPSSTLALAISTSGLACKDFSSWRSFS